MADPLVGATAQALLEKILSLATDRMGLVFRFKKDVELWLKRIEELAYVADDVFDELNYELLGLRVETTQNKDKVCFLFLSFNTVTFRWRMTRKVRDINLKWKLINGEANGCGLQSQLVASGSNTTIHPTSAEVKVSQVTDSVVDQIVVGRVNDASTIVEKLLSPSAEATSFVSINGMGGLGKTTLALLMYNNDPQIDNYFDRTIWVCVSDNFDVPRLFKMILESFWRKNVDIMSSDAIVQEIKNELEGKRYLLVLDLLDDVWCESSTTWDDFLRLLLGITTVEGNWNLVTTHLLQVASNANRNYWFSLERLSDDDSWTILKEKAFPSGEVPEELNAIKEEIIGACEGVPIVAIVIGELLCINEKEVWLSIARNEIPNMTGKRDSVMQILRLSFDHLPSASIKKCFAYCLLFRKGSDMEKNMLIQLWMAEGFVQSNHGNEMEMEAIGLRYFDILVKSSLFQKVTNEYGYVQGRMHDFVHNLMQFVSESETLEQGVRNDHCGARYLVLESLQEEICAMLKERSSLLRTIFVEGRISNDLLLHLKCLPLLNLSRLVNYKELSNSICKLIHLRYLDLPPSYIEALPESLCKFYNLQTLRISGFHSVRKLPEGMSNLISLRHFHCDFWEHFQIEDGKS